MVVCASALRAQGPKQGYQEDGPRARGPWRSHHGDTSRPGMTGRSLLPNVTVSTQPGSPAPRHWTTSTVAGVSSRVRMRSNASRIVPTERHAHGLANAAEDRTAEVDARLVLPDLHHGAASRIRVMHQPSCDAEGKTGAQGARKRANPTRPDPAHPKHRPLRRVVARPFGHRSIHAILAAQKTEHGRERRQSNRPIPQADGIEPVFVKLQACGQQVGNALMQ